VGLQFEKCVRDLQHEDMWVAVIVYDEYAFYGSPHPKVFVVILQALETS
jgi:hypothetical protein